MKKTTLRKTRIEWADYTANPLRGKCPHYGTRRCGTYCYAYRERARRGLPMETSWHPEVLSACVRKQKPGTIFMGSTFDLFARKNDDEYIHEILDAVHEARHHTFLFLTKDVENMARVVFGESGATRNALTDIYPHVWWGASITGTGAFTQRDESAFEMFPLMRRFVSYEPLLVLPEAVPRASGYIIGMQSGPVVVPERAWIDGIIRTVRPMGAAIHIKDNLREKLPDLPCYRELPWQLHTK